MHIEILNERQRELLPLISEFRREYYLVGGTAIALFEYPFDIEANVKVDTYARIPSLLDLAAMKAYALGRRSKWKDYVDLFFIFRDYHSLEKVSSRAKEIFGELFSEKLFRSQLSYFEDIDYTEELDFCIPAPPSGQEIKDYLVDIATQI